MKKLTVILAILAALFLTLSISAAAYSVDRAETAIAALGDIKFDADSRERLDTAIERYDALDTNIHLDERVDSAALDAAKREYVRLAIQTAVVLDQRKAADGNTDEQIIAAVQAARAAVNAYCAAPVCEQIENYANLVELEARYTVTETPGAAADTTGGGESEEIELC